MNVMVLGGGGREHTLAWKIVQSQDVQQVFSLPGNPGMTRLGSCIPGDPADPSEVVRIARDFGIDLVVVGPEAPLASGVVDALNKEKILAFGPNALAAMLESSKIYAKEAMVEAGIPTANYVVFEDSMEAKRYVRARSCGWVVKADGLAAGKGALVCPTTEEAMDAVVSLLEKRSLGVAGDRILIEDLLEGQEASLLALCDGRDCILLDAAQDHKRAYENDTGPNTGGMGAYSPTPVVTDSIKELAREKVFLPLLDLMLHRGCPFRGVLYAGLMLNQDQFQVLEFNVRFGDPETQALLPRISSDLVPYLHDCARGKLTCERIEWSQKRALCVVMASGGYPGDYEKGFPIRGLEQVETMEDVIVFHAGTRMTQEGIVNWGGRVLGVTGLGHSLQDAKNRAYEATSIIHWNGSFYRGDIGWQAV